MSGKTSLWSAAIGSILFPFTPTSIDGMTIGSSTPKAATFTNLHTTSNAQVDGTFGATGKATITQLLRGITALSTGANPSPQGVLNITSTAAKTYTLGANVVGGDVDIICSSSGTASKKVKAAAGVSIFGFLSSAAGSSIAKTSLNFTGKGQAVRLRALSSAALYVMGKSGAVASS